MSIKKEQGEMVRCQWSESASGKKFIGGFQHDIPRRNVYEWIKEFKHGRMIVVNEEGEGNPSKMTRRFSKIETL